MNPSPIGVAALEREYRSAGWRVFVLQLTRVDEDAIFDTVRGALPLDPPCESTGGWDALSDSLWEGLASLPEARIAILVEVPSGVDSRAFSLLDYILHDVAKSLSSGADSDEWRKEVRVHLLNTLH